MFNDQPHEVMRFNRNGKDYRLINVPQGRYGCHVILEAKYKDGLGDDSWRQEYTWTNLNNQERSAASDEEKNERLVIYTLVTEVERLQLGNK